LRIISKKTLRDFWEKYPSSEKQLKLLFGEASVASWRNPNDIKREYPLASILVSNRVVFNINGNQYRLIVRINYHYKIVWIRFVGSHDHYNKIDANKI
jgi:mRNA interferase HigB